MRIRKNVTPALVALVAAGALVLAACGSEVATPTAPEPDARHGGTASAPSALGALDAEASRTISGCTCFVLGYDFATTSCVSSLSSSGNETVSCRGSVSPAPATTQVVFNQPCFLPQTGEYSTISRLVVNSNGGATLRCQAK